MKGQEADEVLARFGEGTALSLRRYRQFIADGIAAGHREDLIGGGLRRSLLGRESGKELTVYDERVLGSGEFVATLFKGDNRRERLAPLARAELLRRVCKVTGVDAEMIIRPGKERAIARARAIFCCLAVRDYDYSGKEAGSVTGLGSAGVSIAVRRGEELMKKDPLLRERIVQRKKRAR